MANNGILVDTHMLDTTGDKVNDLATEYKNDFQQLYQDIEQMRNAWDGEDNIAYTERINGFRNDFDNMYKIMTDYATFLHKAAAEYRNAQDAIASKTSGLSMGN